jgi:hypothetical protein
MTNNNTYAKAFLIGVGGFIAAKIVCNLFNKSSETAPKKKSCGGSIQGCKGKSQSTEIQKLINEAKSIKDKYPLDQALPLILDLIRKYSAPKIE